MTPNKLSFAPICLCLHLAFTFADLRPLAAPAQAPHPVNLEVNEGKKLFKSYCGGCHGEDATGGRGPDLTSGEWKYGGSEADIIRNIRKGIPGTQMPPFPMTEEEAQARGQS